MSTLLLLAALLGIVAALGSFIAACGPCSELHRFIYGLGLVAALLAAYAALSLVVGPPTPLRR